MNVFHVIWSKERQAGFKRVRNDPPSEMFLPVLVALAASAVGAPHAAPTWKIVNSDVATIDIGKPAALLIFAYGALFTLIVLFLWRPPSGVGFTSDTIGFTGGVGNGAGPEMLKVRVSLCARRSGSQSLFSSCTRRRWTVRALLGHSLCSAVTSKPLRCLWAVLLFIFATPHALFPCFLRSRRDMDYLPRSIRSRSYFVRY